MNRERTIKEQIAAFPESSGVYMMKDGEGKILYVGKALNLRDRVGQYFSGSDERMQIRLLLPKVTAVECIVTRSEKEALLLEHNLVQLHRPRYNVNLKDDKKYLSLRLSLADPYPRLTSVRQIQEDGARYFGPYPWAGEIKDIVRYLYRVFPLRSCPDPFFKSRRRPCIRHPIRLCSAPCVGLISKPAYDQMVEELSLFLQGKSSLVVERLEKEMEEASAALEFEKAARLRDRIRGIGRALQKQSMISRRKSDLDAIGLARDKQRLALCLIQSRQGKVVGRESYFFSGKAGGDSEIVPSFLLQYYAPGGHIPRQILLPAADFSTAALAEALGERAGKSVELLTPARGEKRALLDLATDNAAEALLQDLRRQGAVATALEQIRVQLKLPRLPRKIECYDVSHLGEKAAVGARVVFVDGQKENNLYRRYRFAEESGPGDFALMAEMVERRLQHQEDDPPGDLFLLDGGKGQLGAVARVLQGQGRKDLVPVAIAKERMKRGLVDRFFLLGRKNPLLMKAGSAGLKLLASIRDEAHRFAITYHRQLFGQTALQSRLSQIPGIGPRRERHLLAVFGDLQQIAQASPDELHSKGGLPLPLAHRLLDLLHREAVSD